MEFTTKHLGAYSGRPASIIELTISTGGTTITEDIIDFKTGKVPESMITEIQDLMIELIDHNNNVDERNK